MPKLAGPYRSVAADTIACLKSERVVGDIKEIHIGMHALRLYFERSRLPEKRFPVCYRTISFQRKDIPGRER